MGFQSLMEIMEPCYTLHSRRHFAWHLSSQKVQFMATHIHELLAADIPAVSFTTDIWSSDISTVSMPSLTAQWNDKAFNFIKAAWILYIFKHWQTIPKCMLSSEMTPEKWRKLWGIMVWLVWAAWHTPCSWLKIVRDLKNSPLAFSHLRVVQIQGMKPKRLQQDVLTCWCRG